MTQLDEGANSDAAENEPGNLSTTAAGTAPSADPAAAAREEIEALKAKAQENWDRYLRQVAELDNYKKRAARERLDALRYANEALLEKLIPVLDNFEMAVSAANQAPSDSVDSLRSGISMILSQLKGVMTESGLEEVPAVVGGAFDPNLHEAVSQQDSDEVDEGRILAAIRRGYKLKDRLLRPATVVVARKPAS